MDISVFFTSDLTSSERKISTQWTLAYLKKRLEPITGIKPEFQKLQYYPDRSSNEFRVLESAHEDSAMLSEFAILPYSRVHVEDSDPNSHLSDLNSEDAHVQGFELSAEEYSKRTNSVLQWKKQNQLGRYNPQFEQARKDVNEKNETSAGSIEVGSRCRVINIEGERRGCVKFVGKIGVLDEGKSPWVGVEFDEPVGKNDGTIDGMRIFDSKPGHGSFVRPSKVEVGDFPALDPFASSEDEL